MDTFVQGRSGYSGIWSALEVAICLAFAGIQTVADEGCNRNCDSVS